MSYFNRETLEEFKRLKFDVYLRRSSADGEDKQVKSIPGQRIDIDDDIVNKYQLKVNAPYLEESQSAFKQGRPTFELLCDNIERGETQGVIVWHANRIARNYGDGGRFVQFLMDGKIKVLITCSGIFENNPRDLEYLMTEFTRATRDSGDKSIAVKRGNRVKFLEEKKWLGLAKPGFLNVTDPLSKENIIIVDKDRFSKIAKSVRLILNQSYTPMKALAELNGKMNFRTRITKKTGGKPLAKSAWYRLLADPYLYGKLIRREGEVMGNDRKILTEEEFDRLQIILGKNGKPRMSKHEFAYKDVVRCGECGGAITCSEQWQIICSKCHNFKFTRTKQSSCCPQCKTEIADMDRKQMKLLHYVHYYCTKRVHMDCTQGSVRLDKFEKMIDEALARFEIPEVFKDWAIEHLNDLNNMETSDRELVRKNAKEAYDQCVKKLDNLLKLKISAQNSDGSVITDDEYAKQRHYLMSEKDALLENLNNTDVRINRWHDLTAKTFNFACYARFWFAHGDLQTKTQILGALGSNLTIFDKKVRIDGYKNYYLVEKGKNEFIKFARMFEPDKWIDVLGRIDVLKLAIPQWLPS